MKKIILLFLVLLLPAKIFSQGRNINKLTLETTYSHLEIHKSLRDLVDANKKEDYFNDDFFNAMLRRILADKQFSNKEKVQIFYLMQKKLGYAFVGVNYLPPKQSYFVFHSGKVQVLQKTKESLKGINLQPEIFIQIADSHQTNDPVIAANSLLLATLLNAESVTKMLRKYSRSETIMRSKNSQIFNHYVCLSSSLVQDSIIVANLKQNIKIFTQEGMIEDAFCALYSKNNPVSTIRDYILFEKNQNNDLAIETALCALNARVPLPSYRESIKSLLASTTIPWKTELLNKLLTDKIPYNYSLVNGQQLVPKAWDYVQVSIYNDGTLISNNTLLEFDAN